MVPTAHDCRHSWVLPTFVRVLVLCVHMYTRVCGPSFLRPLPSLLSGKPVRSETARLEPGQPGQQCWARQQPRVWVGEWVAQGGYSPSLVPPSVWWALSPPPRQWLGPTVGSSCSGGHVSVRTTPSP